MNRPMDVAKDWLKSAELLKGAKIYEQSLYAMEMAAEIALKAVLLSANAEFPKVHDVRRAMLLFVSGNKRVPKQLASKIDDHIKVFENLLRLRSLAGYGFEGGFDSEELEEQAESLLPKCQELIGDCEKVIEHMEGKRK